MRGHAEGNQHQRCAWEQEQTLLHPPQQPVTWVPEAPQYVVPEHHYEAPEPLYAPQNASQPMEYSNEGDGAMVVALLLLLVAAVLGVLWVLLWIVEAIITVAWFIIQATAEIIIRTVAHLGQSLRN